MINELSKSIFISGHPEDFNKWAADLGDDKWSYKQLLPYFKKSQCHEQGEDTYKGFP